MATPTTPTTTTTPKASKASAPTSVAQPKAISYTVLRPVNAGKGRIKQGAKLSIAELAELGVTSEALQELIALEAISIAE